MSTIRTTSEALQDSQLTDVTLLSWIRPFIFGSKAKLHRFAEADEKTSILAGYYDYSLDTTYEYGGKLSDSVIDEDYTKVFLENALLEYLVDTTGSGSTIAPVSGFANRVRAASLVFKTANGSSRSGALYDRDVETNDIAYVRGTVLSTTYEHWSTVSGFVAEQTAAVTAAATSDTNNKSTQSASASITQVSGTQVNDIAAVASAAAYNSLADSYINRTYLLTVTTGGTGGDATTARLRVRSSDGGDDQDDVVPSAFGVATAIGTKGATVTFSISPSQSSASASEFDEDDFIIGQQWTLTVAQAFTKPVPTSSGTYTGPSDTSYIVRVSLGGKYSDSTLPQVTVSTTTGIDVSGPTDVTATATYINIGTYGVQIKFSQTGLCKGDLYYVACTAVADGAIRTLALTNDLPAGLLAATDLDLRLYIKVPSVEITASRSLPTVGTNWSADQDGLTLQDGLMLTTTGLTSSDVDRYVAVKSGNGWGKVYIEYREWDISLAGTIYRISSRSDVEDTLGIVDPDNPIAYAVDLALQNTATAVVTSPSVDAPDNSDVIICSTLGGDPTDSTMWSDVLDLVAGEDGVYNLIPLTTDSTIQDLVAAHVAAQSTVTVPNYRACMLPASIDETLAIVDADLSSDETVVLATIADDPTTTGTQYTYLNVPANNGNFITNVVRAGDTVRYEYTLDAAGEEAWTEYTVDSVVSESTLKLVAGPTGAVSTAQRVEIWRSPTKAELVTQLTTRAAALASKRVCLVWPDQATIGGDTVSGYFVCAAVGGLAGSVCSHQGLRNVQIQGIDSLPRSRGFFTQTQLDTLKAAGVFVCATSGDGLNYVRSAVTTDPTDVNSTEEMVRRNLDMFMLKLLKDTWGDLIGSANITDYLLSLMKIRFSNLVSMLRRASNAARLGASVISAEITTIEQNETYPDRVTVTGTHVGPYPDNANDFTVNV